MFLWVALAAPAFGQQKVPKILVLGDSLSAAYGLPVQRGWVALLQARLREQGYPHTVVNASISGETSAGGLTRLPVALKTHQPAVLLIELGANDGLRGQPVAKLKDNLTQMVKLAQQAKATPLLIEARIPINYGKAYADSFYAAFSEVGKATRTPVAPFFLASFATRLDMFQDDGIHPNAAAQPLMLDAIWPTLQKLIRKPAD